MNDMADKLQEVKRIIDQEWCVHERELAKKAIELFDAIGEYAGEWRPVPEPFSSLYSELLKNRFEMERIMRATESSSNC